MSKGIAIVNEKGELAKQQQQQQYQTYFLNKVKSFTHRLFITFASKS